MAIDLASLTRAELEEARRALTSTIGKCAKVQPKLRPGTAQHTLLTRRIRALEISVALIDQRLAAPLLTPDD